MSDETKQKTAHEWARETYETFIKDAADIEPTNPEKAIAQYFEKNATDELKARVKAEGKTAAGCYKFIFKVARMVSHGGSCHIDPGVVYAMAMHYFEDVPALAEYEPKLEAAADAKRDAEALKRGDPDKKSKKAKKAKPAKAANKPEPKPTTADAAKSASKPKPAKKSDSAQGFFFDLLEEGGADAHE